MSLEVFHLDPFWPGSLYSTFERVLLAEFLFSQGYLFTEIRRIPACEALGMMMDARRAALRVLAELDSEKALPCKARKFVSLN